jgi:glycosyltransferase involved in cell wall biosynthesis
MNTEFDLSIAVSSYNREDKSAQTLQRLYESDLEKFRKVELIVIDDGSPRPVDDAIARLGIAPEKFELRSIRQENAGIGATRNRGFREARSNLVLFLDDDILVKKETLREIVEAHQKHPGGVIFGSYPFISHETESLKCFARRLYGYDDISAEEKYVQVEALTSGLLAVDKTKLDGAESFYRDDMTIPAAEEYEVISRFHQLGIPIFQAQHISAIHNHHLELDWLAGQQYKYGMGTAEAFVKYPQITDLEVFAELKNKLESIRIQNLKSGLKSALASKVGRRILLRLASVVQSISPSGNHDFLFGLLASSYYWAGYREGTKRFIH